jgi:tRNA(Arg) A34 adenosine deaminase TadA
MGKRPFAAVLVGPDNDTVLLTHQSVDHVNHAEASLARLAACQYTQEYLWTCTLFSTWEPCAMCTSTCYWANIGRIVYAASETQLAELTGQGNEQNMTMTLPCRKVIEGSQKDIKIIGPLEGLDQVVVRESDEYWRPIREAKGS